MGKLETGKPRSQAEHARACRALLRSAAADTDGTSGYSALPPGRITFISASRVSQHGTVNGAWREEKIVTDFVWSFFPPRSFLCHSFPLKRRRRRSNISPLSLFRFCG